MKIKASIMYDNFTFDEAYGNNFAELKKNIIEFYEADYPFPSGYVAKGDSFVAGWGSVTLDGLSKDEYCIFPGLNHRIDLDKLDSAEFQTSQIYNKLVDISNQIGELRHKEKKLLEIKDRIISLDSTKRS